MGLNPNIEIPVGALEVYFKGIRIYSKVMSRRWPNATLVADKCRRVLEAHRNGEELHDFEH